MPQPWEEGNAAREHAPDAPSVFTRVNYEERLQNAGRRARPSQAQSYQPGQMYGVRPPVQSPPPAPAPMEDAPAYMQPPVYAQPQPLQPGAPYGVNAYANGPQPFMPAYEMPVWPEEEPPANAAAEEAPLRDAFEPADEPKPVHKIRKEKNISKPPVRIGRVLALVCAGIMLVTCMVLGARLLVALTQSERDFDQARREYREENGVELQHGAVRVELLPDGRTFPPTPSPTPTVYQPTSPPTPRIPVKEAAMLAAVDQTVEGEAATPEPALRTRQTKYVKNPLKNIMPGLENLIKENGDVVGRLYIPGVLDEVVVQRNNTRYLTRNYLGVGNPAGAVFVDEACALDLPPENLLLRGNSAVPGKTFAPLLQYINGGMGFASANAVCMLTSLYEEEQYVLFAVIQASSDPKSPNYFSYAGYPTFATDEAMAAYVQTARSRSLYAFGVDVQPSDRLLTLATVGGETNVVLMFRMARDGELH